MKNIYKLFLLASIFLTINAGGDQPEKEEDDLEETTSEEEDDNSDYPPADLVYVLFRDIGCQANCSLLGKAYSTKLQSKCENFGCQCTLAEKKSVNNLPEIWKYKFVYNKQSKALLESINSEPEKSAKVLEILQKFPRTESENKNDLINAFSFDSQSTTLAQIQKLKPKKNLPVNELYDNRSRNAIDKFVEQNFDSILDEFSENFLQSDYENKLRIFIKVNFKSVYERFVKAVHQTRNSDLISYFEKLTDLKVESKTQSEYNVPDEIASSLTNAILNYIKNTPKSNAKEYSTFSLVTPNTVKSQIQIPIFISFSKQWQKPGQYDITFDRSGGNTTLKWKVDDIDIKLSQKSRGAVSQTWIFDKVRIELTVEDDGSFTQTWDFGNKSYQQSKRFPDTEVSTWTGGKPSSKLLNQYKSYIITWCQQNYLLYQLYRCIAFL